MANKQFTYIVTVSVDEPSVDQEDVRYEVEDVLSQSTSFTSVDVKVSTESKGD